jgi:hypothetical protein
MAGERFFVASPYNLKIVNHCVLRLLVAHESIEIQPFGIGQDIFYCFLMSLRKSISLLLFDINEGLRDIFSYMPVFLGS